jgi:hypothetical protein
VKLTGAAVFAAGYIFGAKAGHERYAQIVHIVEKTSQRLDEFSSRNPPGRRGDHSGRADRGSRPQKAPH